MPCSCADCEHQRAWDRLDSIISTARRPLEAQWNTDVWQDILLAGNETRGNVLVQRRNVWFKARSLIAFNTSDARLKLSGGIMVPPGCSEFTARVKPPRDVFDIVVDAAPTHSGELYVFLTEELLPPSWAQI